MEEQLVALEAPPRTLDVQQFAKARASELLSLHAALKTKRKAFSTSSILGELQDITRNDCDIVVNEDDANHSPNFSSLPCHLRRRTSSYTRRRRPLPWLYKKKRKAPNSSSPSVSLPNKRCKRRRKCGPLQLQNHCAALPAQASGDGPRCPIISPQVSVGVISSLGGDSITAGTSMSHSGFQQEVSAPLQQPNIEGDQQTLLQVQQQKPCAVASSFAVSIEVLSSKEENNSLQGDVDANESAALPQVVTHEVQQQYPFEVDIGGLTGRCVGGIGTTAPCQVLCNAPQKMAATNGHMPMDIDGLPATSVQIDSHGAHEGAIAPFRTEKTGGCVLFAEDDLVAPAQAGGQVVQQEAGKEENYSTALVQAHSHEIQLEAFAVTLEKTKERTASLGVDRITAPAQVEDDPAQQDGVDLASQVEERISPMHIDGHKLDIEQKVTTIKKKKKKVCRALRRLIEFKPGSSLIASDGTRRLGTHVWHAKRFTMEKKWGYSIPLGRPGRGHGSRAVLRWSKNNALLHDCSFINAIQLHGKEEKIMNVLRLVLELPQGTACCLKTGQRVFSWRDFTPALLHHFGQAPYKIISPVILMWKPVWQEVSTHIHAVKKNKDSEEQDVWLWVHAAAFEEAFQALKDICSRLNEEAKEMRLRCFSRRGELGRLDLVGQESFAVLEKVLFPVCRRTESSIMTLHKLAEVMDPTQAQGNTVVQMEVCDPRLKQSERCYALSPTLTPSVRAFEDRSSFSQKLLEKGDKPVEDGVRPSQDGSRTLETELDHYISKDSMDALWASDSKPLGEQIGPPLKEKFLNDMRRMDRLDSFGFTLQEFGENMNRMLERRKNLAARFRCPVILLKHDHEKASACGWSVVLPLSWISAFWLPLVFAGGHVIGIRERHWLYTDAGVPSFPDDFPDSKAYTDAIAATRSQDTEAVCKRFTKRQKAVTNKLKTGSSQTYDGMLEMPPGMCPIMLPMLCPFRTHDHQCFVTRTSEQLLNYLRRTHQSDLLLFPGQYQMKEKFKGLGERLREGTVAWRARSQMQVTRTVNCDQDVCLLRVSIRPFHKGVVEVGAMVCVPTSDDYTRWSCIEKPPAASTSRDCSYDGSESAIGYVTSMAPRGSKVPAGIAFCSAAALGFARGRQWVGTTWNKNSEIFLLFCNKGSTTFRPAFAFIFLETGPDI